jgi:hypothetical protein
MRIQSASRSALGAALAAVFMLTAVAGPASAQLPDFEVANPKPSIVDYGPLTPKPAPQPTFLPDIQVTYIAQVSLNNQTAYRFKVKNVGIETAYNIGLANTRRQKSNTSNVANVQQGSSPAIAVLASGQEREVGVVCDALAGYHCTTASLTAQLANDLNPNNNKAVSP